MTKSWGLHGVRSTEKGVGWFLKSPQQRPPVECPVESEEFSWEMSGRVCAGEAVWAGVRVLVGSGVRLNAMPRQS